MHPWFISYKAGTKCSIAHWVLMFGNHAKAPSFTLMMLQQLPTFTCLLRSNKAVANIQLDIHSFVAYMQKLKINQID